MVNQIEIMDTTKICNNFPLQPKQEVIRESFLDTIETLFEKHSIVFIEGQEGIGKTTLIAQYAKRHPQNTISIFISPATRSSYDLDMIRMDLLGQVYWVLNNKEMDWNGLENIDINSFWGMKRALLQKKAKSNHQVFIFVIDGLEDIPDKHIKFRDQIVDLLPLGFSNEFKFIIAGSSEILSEQVQNHVPSKSFYMSPFTLDETFQNLQDLTFSREEITEIYKVFKLPGQLASIRRTLQGGQLKTEFMENLPLKMVSLLELEWKRVDLSTALLANALATIAYSSVELNIDDIAYIINSNPATVKELLNPIQFLQINENAKVQFISEAQIKHAQTKLFGLKDEAENRIIEFLKNSKDPMSLTYLPSVLDKTKKYIDLLNYLSPEVFIKILRLNQSLIPLQETAMLGVNAANIIHRDDYLVGLGLQSAIIGELFTSDIWESEINALIAVKDTQSALTLIERATTKEDRLYLLSVLANAKENHRIDIQGLEERIITAYHQIDHKKLGDKSISIASNLINFMPDLAFDIVEKNTDTNNGENSLDWAYAKLSVKALLDNQQTNNSNDIFEKIHNRMKDPKAQNFLTRGSLLFLNFPAAKVIAEVKRIDRVSEQLFLIRSWIKKNREVSDVADVVEYGLQIAISTTDYAPNARDFRDLSTPLPYIKDLDRRRRLINIIDGQKGTIERLGPIEDYIRILVILGVAEKEIEIDACRNRFIEAYLYSDGLDDQSTKSSCLARISSALVIVDPEQNFENKDSLHSLVNAELNYCIDDLLKKTADQYLITKGIIRALAKTRTISAYELANKLNTEDRRNQANYDLAEAILEVPDEKIDFENIKKCLDSITQKSLYDDLLIRILARVVTISDKTILTNKFVLFFLSYIDQIQAAPNKCNALCFGLNILKKIGLPSNENLITNFKLQLQTTWDEIDVGWIKVDFGFKIVEALSDFPELSQQYLERVENYRSMINLDSDGSAMAYLACSRLALRAYSGLLTQNIDTENDITSIIDIIGKIPSLTERIGLYSDLAIRLKESNRVKEFNEIITTKIKPNIEKFSENDGLARQLSIIAAAPILYIHNQVSTLRLITSLNTLGQRDDAYQAICSYIITKRYRDPFFDPASKRKKKLTYDEIMEIFHIIKDIDDESCIYYDISEIMDSIHEHRNSLTRNQKAEIVRTIEEIIPKKLPNLKNIKHEGYKLVSLAKVFQIKETKISEWNDIIDRAKKINIADQVLILSYIAECLPNKHRDLRIKLISDAEKLIKDIPSVYDQIDRYELLSQVEITDRKISEKYLKTGMEIILKNDNSDLIASQRRYIDLAYKLDPEFAASLASMADDDPARANTRTNIQKRLSQLKLKQEISESENINQPKSDNSDNDYPSVAWMLLGALNAGRVAPMRFEAIRDYSIIGSTLPISESYPIFAWLIQNSVVKYKDTPQANDYIRPLFEATIQGCNLIISIAEKSTTQMKIAKSISKELSNTSVVLIDADPEEAKSILKKWLKDNVVDDLYIADPYFGLEELWVLQEIKGINPNCKIYILTSREHNKGLVAPESSFQEYWRINVSDQDPPPTEIIIAETNSSKLSPIHDRWWVSGEAGLRIGTSLNALGGYRISEIGSLSISEAEERGEIIKRFVIQKIRDYKGERIRYSSFTM
jgi:hypothetical protein